MPQQFHLLLYMRSFYITLNRMLLPQFFKIMYFVEWKLGTKH